MAHYKLSINAKDLKEDSVVEAEINGTKYAVFLHQGKIHVMGGTCSHEQGPLYDGSIDNNELICPWHSAAYNIDTGQVSENTPWAPEGIVAYIAKIDSATGEVSIEM